MYSFCLDNFKQGGILFLTADLILSIGAKSAILSKVNAMLFLKRLKIMLAVLIVLAVSVLPIAFSVSYARWQGGGDSVFGKCRLSIINSKYVGCSRRKCARGVLLSW